MEQTNIVILLTTHNDAEEIDKTIASIRAQDFPQKNIWTYIVDFDSSDGTYEKALAYDSYHTAVFQIPDVYNEWARGACAVQFMNSQLAPCLYRHMISLKAGDVLYESCCSTCVELADRYRPQVVPLLICEADVASRDGKIMRQNRIAEQELLFDPLNNINLLLEHFFDHYVGYFGGGISPNYAAYIGSERCFWNKTLYTINSPARFLYVPQPQLCLKERSYRDEVDELLSRWVGIITFQRGFEGMTGQKVVLNVSQTNRNLANYSLWRIVKRYPELTQKEREDLLYLAGTIDASIEKEEIYAELKGKIMAGAEIAFSDYQGFFEREHRKGQQKIDEAIQAGSLFAAQTACGSAR